MVLFNTSSFETLSEFTARLEALVEARGLDRRETAFWLELAEAYEGEREHHDHESLDYCRCRSGARKAREMAVHVAAGVDPRSAEILIVRDMEIEGSKELIVQYTDEAEVATLKSEAERWRQAVKAERESLADLRLNRNLVYAVGRRSGARRSDPVSIPRFSTGCRRRPRHALTGTRHHETRPIARLISRRRP